MKKRILFVINSLTIGGSEKSLVSLLNTIDYSKYDVDLMMLKVGEEFDIYIPKEVNILDIPNYYKFLSDKSFALNFKNKINFLITRLKTSINLRINSSKKNHINNEQILYKSQRKILSNLDGKYDIAIAYSQGVPTYFVADKVNANKKIAWINCDYATTKYDKDIDEKFYNKFDKIVAVSETIRKSIIDIKPQYKDKIEVILDIVNPSLIEKMAMEHDISEYEDCINILTVARLVIDHKGYDIAIKTAEILKKNGYKFKWYVIGDGPDKVKISSLIDEYNIKDCFILLGKRENPYPYMKNCDIYVQPSKREGFGLTVVEAKILNKPIVCTDFNTAKELINNEYDGLIAGHSEEELYLSIKRYIDDIAFRDKIVHTLKNNLKYNSINEIYKVYNLLN